jgi:hypothetical protein
MLSTYCRHGRADEPFPARSRRASFWELQPVFLALAPKQVNILFSGSVFHYGDEYVLHKMRCRAGRI